MTATPEVASSRPSRRDWATPGGAAAWCCSADTLLASLSIASTIRPTKGRNACFVNVWPMLIVRKRPPAVGPGAFPDPPPRAWGPRRFSTEEPGPVLRAGPDADTRPRSPRGIAKGTEVACGTSSPRRTARGSNYARLIRHSVGQKVANTWNIAGKPQFAHYGRNSPGWIVRCKRSAARGANGHVAPPSPPGPHAEGAMGVETCARPIGSPHGGSAAGESWEGMP
jgi:hypothetical protein